MCAARILSVVLAFCALGSVVASSAEARAGNTSANDDPPLPASAESGLKALLAGVTAVHFDNHHGTQVEYLSPAGSAYLWYPGNRPIVAGEWEVRVGDGSSAQTSICYRYGPSTYNPVTGRRGGNWECSLSPPDRLRGARLYAGDPFGLSKNYLVPFILESSVRYTFDDLNAVLGR